MEVLGRLQEIQSRRPWPWSGPVRDKALRGSFQRDFALISKDPTIGHSHGLDAAIRTNMATSINAWLTSNGYEPYLISMGVRDLGQDGRHAWKIPKDLQMPRQRSPLRHNSAIVMIDVDYYLDMRRYMRKDRPIVIFTFCPGPLCGRTRNTWYTMEDDHFVVSVDGGGKYKHRIYDYDRDCIMFKTYNTLRVFNVETKNVPGDSNRRVVLLTLIKKLRWFRAWKYMMRFGSRDRLRYKGFSTVGGGYPYSNRYKNADGVDMISLMPYPDACAEVPYEAFSLAAMKVVTDGEVSQGTVEKILKGVLRKVDKSVMKEVFVLVAYLKMTTSVGAIRANGGTIKETNPTPYTAMPKHPLAFECLDQLNKTSAVIVGPVMVNCPAIVPSLSINNEIAALQGRVEKPQQKVTPAGTRYIHAREFASLVIPASLCHFGNPLTEEEVGARQSKRNQRERFHRVRDCLAGPEQPTGKMFVKLESYAGPTDPRPITMTNTVYQLKIQAVIMKIKDDVLDHLPWYTPGKSNTEIAERVVDQCRWWDGVIETDYSRFDGTIGKWLRIEIEEKIIARWIMPCYRREVIEMVRGEHHLPVYTRGGLFYITNGQRCSGTPLTTFGNTLVTAFVQYSALRELNFGREEAFNNIGCVFGDDGLVALKDPRLPAALEMVSSDLGLKLKSTVKARGDYVEFLSRHFYPWDGDTGSIQNPIRSLPKIHISVSGGRYKLAQCQANKGAGLLALDPLAPVFSNYARLLLRVSPAVPVEENPDESYSVKIGGTWPQMEYSRAMTHIAELVDAPVWLVRDLCDRLDRADSVNVDLPRFDLPVEPPKIEAMVGDEIVHVEDQIPDATETAVETASVVSSSVSSARHRRRKKKPTLPPPPVARP